MSDDLADDTIFMPDFLAVPVLTAIKWFADALLWLSSVKFSEDD